MGYRKPKEFRKNMKHWNVTIASGDVKFERKLARMARDKKNGSEPEEMYKKINELVEQGKSAEVIRKIIGELFPELAKKKDEQKIPLGDEEVGRLTLQIRNRVEEFRNSLPEQEDDERTD